MCKCLKNPCWGASGLRVGPSWQLRKLSLRERYGEVSATARQVPTWDSGLPLSRPLSSTPLPPQEVSAFGEDGEGDDLDLWTVRCSGQHWEREAAVRFQHVGTSVFLSVTGEQYGSPIRGQHEVHGMASASAHNKWKAMEGIFIKPGPEAPGGHDEL